MLVSPLQGCGIPRTVNPGRRCAADAAALCPGLVCVGLSGRKGLEAPCQADGASVEFRPLIPAWRIVVIDEVVFTFIVTLLTIAPSSVPEYFLTDRVVIYWQSELT